MLQLKLGTKGEILIPKKIRDQLGFTKNRIILLEVKDKRIELQTLEDDIIKKWEERAKRQKQNISHWTYGDKLYEEVF